MKGSETRSGLKLKLNEQFKKEGYKPITIKTIVYHLRDPNKNGLIDMGIVEEKNGLLKLSLTTPRKIAEFIDQLSKNRTVGPRVSYFIDRIFAESFLSPFGDRFSNYNRIHKVVDFEIHNIVLSPELKQYKENYRLILFILLQSRMFPSKVVILSRLDPLGPLPFYSDASSDVELDEEKMEKIIELANKSDLLSIIIGASKEIRGEIDTFFKVCYILNVLDRVHFLHRAEVNSSIKGLINILDLTMFHMPNWEIEKINPASEILEEFKELLFKAINGSFYEDRSFNEEYAILGLNKEDIDLSSKESSLGREISGALFAPLLVDKETSIPKESGNLSKERIMNGLGDTRVEFY